MVVNRTKYMGKLLTTIAIEIAKILIAKKGK